MAIKKSDLYSSLWASCDELRGGMDASQYKGFVRRSTIACPSPSLFGSLKRVTLVAPTATRLDVARAYAISKLSWIREQQRKLKNQARETPRQFIERESHYFSGRRYLMTVLNQDAKPCVTLDHKRITLTVRPGSDARRRADVIHEWHKSILHEVVPTLIKKWEPKLEVKVGQVRDLCKKAHPGAGKPAAENPGWR